MKLRITVVVEQDVDSLVDYEATTLEEAATNQQEWLDNGSSSLWELIDFADEVTIKVEPVP